jgi:DNA polymerase-3 subunit alpha
MTHDPDQLNRFLKYKVIKGFREAGLPMTQPYLERIDFELGIIKQMGFDQYFLIVADLCRFMRSKKIKFLVRGSGCGSCVVWGLRISHKWLDPIQYGLPFERFLNPSRVTMPDLDIDIQDDRRHEVVTYTLEKYGRDRVARIITFGTMGAKVAIADTCRALQIENYQEVAAKITALIPAGKGEDGKNIRIADELKRNEALREQQKLYPQVFEMAQKIEGKVRHASIHAAGIIIAPDVITKYAPLFFKGNPDNRSEEDNFPTIQWDMYDAEERGMLKMDFLGLKTLRVIDQTERQIREVQKARGEAPTFDIDEIDRYDDPAWRVLAAGQTAGVFQIERGFVRNFARRMSLMRKDPWQLAILISIIRPGMMDTGATEEYLKRASGKSAPTPLDALLEETLRGNFGLFVFQEDCMWAAVRMAGLSLSKADELRRAIGKKKPKDMAAIKPEFIQGCIKNGATLEEHGDVRPLRVQQRPRGGLRDGRLVPDGLPQGQLARPVHDELDQLRSRGGQQGRRLQLQGRRVRRGVPHDGPQGAQAVRPEVAGDVPPGVAQPDPLRPVAGQEGQLGRRRREPEGLHAQVPVDRAERTKRGETPCHGWEGRLGRTGPLRRSGRV